MLNDEHEIGKYLKICCGIQEAQGKEIDYRVLNNGIKQKYEELAEKATLIKFDEITPGEERELMGIGTDENRDIENIEKLLNFIKIVEIYPA